MAREFDANQVSNWAHNRAKKGAGSVGGAAAAGAAVGAAAGGDDGAAAAGGESDAAAAKTLGQCLRGLEEDASAHMEALSEIKLPAADAKAFRKRLDALTKDMKTFLEDVGEFADDYDEEHKEDEGSDESDDEGTGEDDSED